MQEMVASQGRVAANSGGAMWHSSIPQIASFSRCLLKLQSDTVQYHPSSSLTQTYARNNTVSALRDHNPLVITLVRGRYSYPGEGFSL